MQLEEQRTHAESPKLNKLHFIAYVYMWCIYMYFVLIRKHSKKKKNLAQLLFHFLICTHSINILAAY